jgi:hypothetical protein
MGGSKLQGGNLRASISSRGTLSGAITSKGSLIATVSKPAFIGGEQYEGSYEVTPKLEAQTLPTKDKVLIADVTIKEIEIHRVKNSSGGTTIYIARGA